MSEELVLRSFNIPVTMDKQLGKLSEMSGVPKAHLLRVMVSTQMHMLRMFMIASRFQSMEHMAKAMADKYEEEFGQLEVS